MSDIAWTVQTNAVGTYDVRSTCGSSRYIVADDLPIEDARMIAAAPDLYEALHNVMLRFGPGTMEAQVFEDACNALRKARGETP